MLGRFFGGRILEFTGDGGGAAFPRNEGRRGKARTRMRAAIGRAADDERTQERSRRTTGDLEFATQRVAWSGAGPRGRPPMDWSHFIAKFRWT